MQLWEWARITHQVTCYDGTPRTFAVVTFPNHETMEIEINNFGYRFKDSVRNIQVTLTHDGWIEKEMFQVIYGSN
jgi:hypothetical protein